MCFEIYSNPFRYAFSVALYLNPGLNRCSLDCRHVFCGLCIADWFASRQENTCPECRTPCVAYPQRDFALRHILPVIYSGLGREMPTAEGLNATLFARIYAMMEESKGQVLTLQQRTEFWAPMISEVRRMQDGNPPAPTPPAPTPPAPTPPEPTPPEPIIDVDVEMEQDDADSDWEPGSAIDEEDEASEMGDV